MKDESTLMWLSKLSAWQLQIFNTLVHYLPSLGCNHICASARHVAVCQNFKHGDWLSFYGLILTCLFWVVSSMQHMDTFSQLPKPGAFFYTLQLTLSSGAHSWPYWIQWPAKMLFKLLFCLMSLCPGCTTMYWILCPGFATSCRKN